MTQPFYRAFEDRHRGSRSLIKARLCAYLPFLAPLPRGGEAPRALDLGCGRGEWLELLAESGFDARGVDLDQGMLAACRERGLQVECADALATLRACADASVDLVSAFHLVEHIGFDQVQQMASEALRALRPGGLLIMETPNPENLVVASSGFHMDPSHVRPLPPMLLDFVVEYAGFARRKVVRLQEAPQLHDEAPIALMTVLDGVSPDYSVVAQKTAAAQVLQAFDAAFDASYGIDLAALAQRYESGLQERWQQLERRLDTLELHSSALDSDAAKLIKRSLQALDEARAAAQSARDEVEQAARREHERAEQRAGELATQLDDMRARATEAEQKVQALQASSSWRVTGPLRALKDKLRGQSGASAAASPPGALRRHLRKGVYSLIRRLAWNPTTRALGSRTLARFPALDAKARALVYKAMNHQSNAALPALATGVSGTLPRSAQRIYAELQSHLQEQPEKN